MAVTVNDFSELGVPPEVGKKILQAAAESGLNVPRPAIADVGSAPTQAQHNAVLAALRAAGIILP